MTLSWLTMMMRGDRDAATQYDLRGDPELLRTAAGVPTISFGYWRDVPMESPDALWRASVSAFDLVGEVAEMGAADTAVLDVGCGFGAFARYAVERLRAARLVGLNVSSYQLARCRRMAAEAGLAQRLTFQEGDATRMPFADGTFDRVVSIEAAFHFAPRRSFLGEALRVLKPGGVLALLDLVPLPPCSLRQRLQLGLLCRALQFPMENACTPGGYARVVADCGFQSIELRSIREHVLPPYERWLRRQPLRRLLSVGAIVALSAGSLFSYPLEYICLKAKKAR